MGWLLLTLASAHALPGLTPLTSVDRHTPDADLAAFVPLIADAEWVGLGESRHACGTFLEAKARLVRWLVAEHGYRVVAIESPWTRARPAQDFVARGEGRPDKAMRSVFPAFWDSQTAELLQWLRDWNVAHPGDPVHFVGFDVQDHAEELEAFLATEGLSEAEIAACRAGPCAVPEDRPWARLAADQFAIRTALDQANGDTPWAALAYANLRDRGMADTLVRVRELVSPGARTVVLAHNGHLVRQGSAFAWKDTGEHLAERFGARWVAIGLAAEQVDTMGQGWARHDDRRALEARIGRLADSGVALLEPGAADWLTGRWDVGGRRVVPADQYDGLLFFAHTRPADTTWLADAPFATAQAMNHLGRSGAMDVVAVHRTAAGAAEGERLWASYLGWLAQFGFAPVAERRGAGTHLRQSLANPQGAGGSLEVRWEHGEWRVWVRADALTRGRGEAG